MSVFASIVVTAFNHASFVRQALESVMTQMVDGLEIIVVDDGSTDETRGVAQAFAQPGIRIVSKANGGPSSAVNAGLDEAAGDYIVLFSADDVMTEGSIERRLDVLRTGRADFVCSTAKWIGKDGRALPREACPLEFPLFSSLQSIKLFTRLYYGGNFICAPSVAFTRSALDLVGRFDENLWQLQDYDYWLRASAAGMRFHCLAEPSVAYRWHGSNLSSSESAVSAWEADIIQARSPALLGRADMLEILFGESFRNVKVALLDDDCRALIRMRHARQSTAAGGRSLFQALTSTVEGCDRYMSSLS